MAGMPESSFLSTRSKAMPPSRIRPFRDWKGWIIEAALKGSLLIGLAALALWLWPDSMPGTPLSLVPISDWLWALGAAWIGLLFALACYFVVVIPFLDLLNREE
jgi:hypothetical protein